MEITYNPQGVPSIGFDRAEVSELERKEFRVTLKDRGSGSLDLTITPYSQSAQRVSQTGEKSFRYYIDGDVKTLRNSGVLPVELYAGFRVYLTTKKQ